MSHRFDNSSRPGPLPVTPMVYVREKTIWEYKIVSRNLSKEEALNESELKELGEDSWELAGMFADSPFVSFYFKRIKD